MTQRERQQVLVSKGIVGLTEEGHQRVTLTRTLCYLLATTGTGPHIVGVQH